ncbi:thymidylate synthase (FAD) [Anaerosphaera aminiphila DSM 21120]|uniref:Flavin-dependent thymidylate synthase n=1 Tax=Anaerosphaera aminiphila DSM 21120 TaxID=1120995 RepID=A0A1M5TQW5_9FIRM|nr:FAD-dependent thymidylate synthase [Anaerosphaera aminiphila]SHH53079.1 thymidylate synthase (FAD) [Anaerosphaera aminiphila DSM 21120]
MKVEIIANTPNPEEVIAQAAKLCYSAVGVDEIREKMTVENRDKFLNMLMSFSHASPLEHASFTFAVEGVSRTLTHQLVRHRIASYSQQSQRYVRLDNFEYIIPPEIAKNEEALKVYKEIMQKDKEAYQEITELLITQRSKELIDGGMDEKKARKKVEKDSIEDARYVFPNACETKIVFTMNVRTLLHFFELRCCNRAQWEIRELATEMLKECKKISPILFKDGGPGCVNGPCPEGAMTCGKITEVREFFRNLGE